MPQSRYAPVHRLAHRVAASPLGIQIFSRVQHHLDRAIFRLTNGRYTAASVLAGVPIVTVVSVGAKSGLPRTTPLLPIQVDSSGEFALIASNWGRNHHPAWYYNLKANPQASCTIRGVTTACVAHEATGEEYDRFWAAAVDTAFAYTQYKKRISGRHIPIMVMRPISISTQPSKGKPNHASQ